MARLSEADAVDGQKVERLICSICSEIFQDPVFAEGKCQCVFCRECITMSLKARPECPLCQTKVTAKVLNSHRWAAYTLDDLEVYCPHRCSWQGPYENRAAHLLTCQMPFVLKEMQEVDKKLEANEQKLNDMKAEREILRQEKRALERQRAKLQQEEPDPPSQPKTGKGKGKKEKNKRKKEEEDDEEDDEEEEEDEDEEDQELETTELMIEAVSELEEDMKAGRVSRKWLARALIETKACKDFLQKELDRKKNYKASKGAGHASGEEEVSIDIRELARDILAIRTIPSDEASEESSVTQATLTEMRAQVAAMAVDGPLILSSKQAIAGPHHGDSSDQGGSSGGASGSGQPPPLPQAAPAEMLPMDQMLQRYQQLNKVQKKRNNKAFLEAAATGDYNEVVRLVSEGLCVLDATDSSGNTALHKAVEAGDKRIVEFLVVKAGADINRKGDGGATPLSMATDIATRQILQRAGRR